MPSCQYRACDTVGTVCIDQTVSWLLYASEVSEAWLISNAWKEIHLLIYELS